MAVPFHDMSRLQFLKTSGYAAGSLFLPSFLPVNTEKQNIILKKIPATGELIPAVGLGSWITFNVGEDELSLKPMRDVLKTFIEEGGKLVDSSPMYGRSEKVIGLLAKQLGLTPNLFFATKIWTSGETAGKNQINNSRDYFNAWPSLLQVHNLQDVQTHLKTLKQLKDEGKLKYIGITHYLNSYHDEMIKLVKNEKLDFIQVNVSIRNRAAEDSLIPLAADKGVAVIINRPFETGALFNTIRNAPLPGWAADWGINTWAAFFLKYIISNKNITCAIPATSRVTHLKENMAALRGNLPDGATRKKMIDYYTKTAS
jgi:diketogulonate reductase-like aldo/keto reductase